MEAPQRHAFKTHVVRNVKAKESCGFIHRLRRFPPLVAGILDLEQEI